MTKRMLIDASHAEETRVVVLDGNRLEDYDVETSTKKQLKGNIYLAKVVRVEPSLQAAFVEYGGNRHGFLAFSEIHPDYYQIPVADRQRLLELQEQEAREEEEAEDEAAEAAESGRYGRTPNGGGRDRAGAQRRDGRQAAAAESYAARTQAVMPEAIGSEAIGPGAIGPEAIGEDAVGTASAGADASRSDADGPGIGWMGAGAEQDDAADGSGPAGGVTEIAGEAGGGLDPDTHHGRDALDAATEATIAAAEAMHPGEAGSAGSVPGSEGAAPVSGESGDDAEDEAGGSAPTAMPAAITRDVITGPVVTGANDVDPVEDDAGDAPPTSLPTPAAPAHDEEGASGGPVGVHRSEGAVAAAQGHPVHDEPGTVPEMGAIGADLAPEAAEPVIPDEEDSGEADEIETIATDAPPPETVGGESTEERPERRMPPRFLRNYKIQEVIKRRQILLVQVVKEERGTKGAALTTYISLAGRYCVLMPNSPRGGGISRKITSAADRRRLKEITQELDIPRGMGLIVRTAGAQRPKPEIKRDCEYLLRLWDDIREHTLRSVAPALIYEEASLIKRAIRDVYSRDVEDVLVDGEEGWKAARDFMRMLMPAHAKKVQLWRDGGQPLFAKNQVEAQLDAMLSPVVQLRSGGYLVINQTEALVAIDVNSGRSTRERGIEETALRTNLEAADEVARQLRLRDLAGLIVIDFIDMESRKHNAAVERRLKEALKNDRARIQVGHISHFGLMEMSRQRLRPSLAETSFIACPHCGGTGHVRSTESSALHVLRAIEDEGAKRRAAEIVVHVATGIAMYVLNHKRQRLAEIEARYVMRVSFSPDDALMPPQSRIERVRAQSPDAVQAIRQEAPARAPIIEIEAEEVADLEDVVEAEEAMEAAEPPPAAAPPQVAAPQPAARAPEARPDAEADGEGERRRRRRRRRRRGRRDEMGQAVVAEAGEEDEGAEGFEGAEDEESGEEAADIAVGGAFAAEPDAAPDASSAAPDFDPIADAPELTAEQAMEAAPDVPFAAGTPTEVADAEAEEEIAGVPAEAALQEVAESVPTDAAASPVAAEAAEEPAAPRRRRTRTGVRRRKRGEEAESAEAAPAASPPPAYTGPTPADPYAGQVYDIFDAIEQVEGLRGQAAAAPHAGATAALAAETGAVPVERIQPGEAGVIPADEPPTPVAPEPGTETAVPVPAAEPAPVPPAPQSAAEPEAEEPKVGPAVQPILVGSDAAPAEKKRGWWRR